MDGRIFSIIHKSLILIAISWFAAVGIELACSVVGQVLIAYSGGNRLFFRHTETEKERCFQGSSLCQTRSPVPEWQLGKSMENCRMKHESSTRKLSRRLITSGVAPAKRQVLPITNAARHSGMVFFSPCACL